MRSTHRVRAYNRGKPFTGLTTALESTPLLKGISTSTACKLQYDVPIYIGTVDSVCYGGTFEMVIWSVSDPEELRRWKSWWPHISPIEVFGRAQGASLRGLAIEVDPPKPEYEPDAR